MSPEDNGTAGQRSSPSSTTSASGSNAQIGSVTQPYDLKGIFEQQEDQIYSVATPYIQLHDKITLDYSFGFVTKGDESLGKVGQLIGDIQIYNSGDAGALQDAMPLRVIFGTHEVDCGSPDFKREDHRGDDGIIEGLNYTEIDPYDQLARLRDVQSMEVEFGGVKYRLPEEDLRRFRGFYIEVMRKMEQYGSNKVATSPAVSR